MPGDPLTTEELDDIRAMAAVVEDDALPVDEAWAIDVVMPLLPRLLATLDAALAALPPVAPDGADLDVETLARAMAPRDGMSSKLGRGIWRKRAADIAAEYRRLRAGERGKG